MKTSAQGIDLIIAREGEKLHTYKDTKGVWTIGVGHTSAAGAPSVVPGMTITAAKSREILTADLAKVEKQVNAAVKVKITQNQFDALVSVFLNTGPAFATSTAVKKLNSGGTVASVAAAFMNWSKPPEIIPRRRGESVQFLGTAFKARIA